MLVLAWLANAGYICIGVQPPPEWDAAGPAVGSSWRLAGFVGMAACSICLLSRKRVTAVAAQLFRKHASARDFAFVSDLLKAGGNAAEAANELVEMAQSLSMSPEVVRRAADAIRVDSEEQQAYVAAKGTVHQALTSHEARDARATLLRDAKAMDEAAITGQSTHARLLFKKMQKLSVSEQNRLNGLMVLCRKTFCEHLSTRWNLLESLPMWQYSQKNVRTSSIAWGPMGVLFFLTF